MPKFKKKTHKLLELHPHHLKLPELHWPHPSLGWSTQPNKRESDGNHDNPAIKIKSEFWRPVRLVKLFPQPTKWVETAIVVGELAFTFTDAAQFIVTPRRRAAFTLRRFAVLATTDTGVMFRVRWLKTSITFMKGWVILKSWRAIGADRKKKGDLDENIR